MKNFRIATWATIAVVVLAAAASLLIPVPATETPLGFYVSLLPSVATALLYIGGSAVLLMGFGAFTDKLRRPYIAISTGLIIWGLSYLLLPTLVITNQLSNEIVLSVAALGSTVTAIVIFAGAKRLAKLFDIKTVATNWFFVIGMIVLVSVVIAISPHAPYDDEFTSDTANVVLMLPNIFFAFSAYLILQIKRQASVTFTNALAWLYLSMFFTSIIAFGGSTIVSLALGSAGDFATNLVAIVGSCIAAAMFLRSAYSFNEITESKDVEGAIAARDFFGRPREQHVQADSTATSVDIVVYAASLVSNPHEIDGTLEEMREVTAQSGGSLSDSDNERLMSTYLAIEDYLLKKEPLRVFTKDSLRHDIAHKLRLSSAAGSFWPKLV